MLDTLISIAACLALICVFGGVPLAIIIVGGQGSFSKD